MSDDETEQQEVALAAQSRAGQMVRRDFSGTSMMTTSASTEALVASARAMTEARWIMAMRAPRNVLEVRQEILAECKRPGFAEVATYRKPVGGGSHAEGLSIRFAEVAMRRMRNMQCKSTITYEDDKVRMITVSAVDYETNATWDIDLTVKKTVERRQLKPGQRPLGERVNSSGERVFIVEATDSDVATKSAAEVSKAARTCILRLVPGEIQDEAFELCKKVAGDRDAKDPQATAKRMLDAFADLGVKAGEVELWLGKPVAARTRDDAVQLNQIIAGIREGDVLWAEVLAQRVAERDVKPAKPASAPASPPQAQDPATPARAAPTRTSSGKGASALKATIGTPASPPAAKPEVPPGTPPPPPGIEDRACAACGDLVEVPTGAPPGQICASCARQE